MTSPGDGPGIDRGSVGSDDDSDTGYNNIGTSGGANSNEGSGDEEVEEDNTDWS